MTDLKNGDLSREISRLLNHLEGAVARDLNHIKDDVRETKLLSESHELELWKGTDRTPPVIPTIRGLEKSLNTIRTIAVGLAIMFLGQIVISVFDLYVAYRTAQP